MLQNSSQKLSKDYHWSKLHVSNFASHLWAVEFLVKIYVHLFIPYHVKTICVYRVKSNFCILCWTLFSWEWIVNFISSYIGNILSSWDKANLSLCVSLSIPFLCEWNQVLDYYTLCTRPAWTFFEGLANQYRHTLCLIVSDKYIFLYRLNIGTRGWGVVSVSGILLQNK